MLYTREAEARANPLWATTMVAQVQRQLGRLFPLRDEEIDFVRRVRDEGKITPNLITTDPVMIDRIAEHSMLRWRAQHRVNAAVNPARMAKRITPG